MKIPGFIARPAARFLAAVYDAADRDYSRAQLGYGRTVGRDEDNAVPQVDRETTIQQAIDLYRNDPIVHGIVERFADNVVGSGITPQAKTSDEKWNVQAEEFFNKWAKKPDPAGRFSLIEMQRMSLRCPFVFGDMLYQILDSGYIVPVEGERIRSPEPNPDNMIHGLLIDPATGTIKAFNVFNRDEKGIISARNPSRRIDADNAIFLSRPFRPDQYRGIPEIAPLITLARDMKEIREAFVAKVKLEGLNAWKVTTLSGINPANMGPRGTTTDASSVQYAAVKKGKIHYLRPGEDMGSLSNNTPSPQFAQFIEMMIRQMGATIGLPYEFVLQDFSKGSYSSSRAALLQTYQTFNIWQRWIVEKFLQRLWNWRISKAIKARLIPQAPIDDNGISEAWNVYWNFPEWEWVDPQSQQQADLLAFQLGVKSHTDLVAKRGKDSAEVLRQKFRDMATAQEIADEINAEAGTSFTWQDGIYANIPGQVQGASEQESKESGGESSEKVGNKWLT